MGLAGGERERLNWTLKIMHIPSELSGLICMHRANYKERKRNGEKQFTKRTAERKRPKKNGNFVCQAPLNAVSGKEK